MINIVLPSGGDSWDNWTALLQLAYDNPHYHMFQGKVVVVVYGDTIGGK